MKSWTARIFQQTGGDTNFVYIVIQLNHIIVKLYLIFFEGEILNTEILNRTKGSGPHFTQGQVEPGQVCNSIPLVSQRTLHRPSHHSPSCTFPDME